MTDYQQQAAALEQTEIYAVPQQTTGYRDDQTVAVVQGKGSDTQSPNEAEDEAEGEADPEIESSEPQDAAVEDATEIQLKDISNQQQVLSNQYAYLARCLARALDARLAQTLGLMDEAARTRQESPPLAQIYASHLERLQDKYRAPATVEAELQYEMQRIRSSTRSNGLIAWADFTKKKNDLQIKMCSKVSAEMVAHFREKRISDTGDLRVMDWISNNLDVVHDLGGAPVITRLSQAEISRDLERLKDKPVTIKEEINLDEFDTEESNDFLHQLADLAHQQPPELARMEPEQPPVIITQPPPPHQVQHHQPPPQQQSHQPSQQQSQLPPSQVVPHQDTASQQALPPPQSLQVPIESHTTTRLRSRSNSKAARHHSISPAPKRHRHSGSTYQMHPQSPYQVQVQPQMAQPQQQQQQQQQQQHLPQPVAMVQQMPQSHQQQQQQHFSLVSPQQSHMGVQQQQQQQQQQMNMYYDSQQQQQQQRPQHLQHQPVFMPQSQPIFMTGYEQHPQFPPPPPQWASQPKPGFAQSPSSFPQPMPGMMPGNYYYAEQQHPQHPPPPPPHLHQQYYPGYEQR